MGIPMGQPFYQIRGLTRQGLVALSGDLAYYRHVSDQVMDQIRRFSDQVEQYSVDEAFFNLKILSEPDPLDYALRLSRHIVRRVGVPVAVGVAATKTLAKVAARGAKNRGLPALRITESNSESFLSALPVGQVWGVGRRTEAKLHRMGLLSALDLARADLFLLKKRMSVRESMLALELRGCRQWPLCTLELPAKSLTVSRTMAEAEYSPERLWKRLYCHVTEAARRLREGSQQAGKLFLFARTSHFASPYRKVQGEVKLSRPTNYEPDLVSAAEQLFRRIFVAGPAYRASGVTLSALTDARAVQLSFEDLFNPAERKKLLLSEWMTALARGRGAGGGLLPRQQHPETDAL